MMAKPVGRSPTWKPRLVKMPVPTMLATTMQVAVTARAVGRTLGLVDVSVEDLYDPKVVIKLGARYVADLQREFDGDPYKTAAAYNAGPNQAKLWARLAPGPGDDFFLSSVNFDETKDYVRKVMNSYERYGEIYATSSVYR